MPQIASNSFSHLGSAGVADADKEEAHTGMVMLLDYE
jgi:hypothetical protein